MGRDSYYIDLNDWMKHYHPELAETRTDMIISILEELKINEYEEVIITADYKTLGLFFNYLLSKAG